MTPPQKLRFLPITGEPDPSIPPPELRAWLAQARLWVEAQWTRKPSSCRRWLRHIAAVERVLAKLENRAREPFTFS